MTDMYVPYFLHCINYLVFLQYHCKDIFFGKFMKGKSTKCFVQIKINSSDTVIYFFRFKTQAQYFISKLLFPTFGR